MFEWFTSPTPKGAYYLSLVSLVITLLAAIGGLASYKVLDSSLLLVYGLENCVDFFSSAVVLWRFNQPEPEESADSTHRNTILANREQRAAVAISFVLIILGLGVTISAIEDMAKGNENEKRSHLWVLYYLSFLSVIVFGALTIVKFKFGNVLKSSSLRKDGVCSLIGASTAGALFVNTILIMTSDGEAWWLDPLVATLCGIGAFFYGMWGIYKPYVKEGLPIFSCSWWSEGEDGAHELEMEGKGGGIDGAPASPSPVTSQKEDGIFGKDAVDITDIDLT